MADDARGAPMFSRADVLGGLPARRAATTLFAIESRTARLVARSHRAMATYLTDRSVEQQERAFLEAFAEGRDPPMRPTIRDINGHAADWAELVPPDPALRAELAHQLARKYRFTNGVTRPLREALTLDEPGVIAAYRRLHGGDIDSVFAPSLPLGERLAWARSGLGYRLEHLSPFWTAFSLTLTETVGAGVLALPIALAGMGPGFAVGLIVVFGLINLLTIAALVEAISRSGSIRYGTAYFGRLVRDYLGSPGAIVVGITLFAMNALVIISYVSGFGAALQAATGVPSVVWGAALMLVVLTVLRRGGLDATVASALVIGAVNITLLITIAVLAGTHADPARLAQLDPPTLDGNALGLVFGVVLGAYFGHTSAGNAAKVVLAREPTGRALVRGNVAAMASAIVLYVAIVGAVNSAVPAEALRSFNGAAITPLAEVVGPSVTVLGTIFIFLAIGLATVIFSLGLFNQTIELAGDAASQSVTIRRLLASRWPRFALAAAPVAGTFLIALFLLASGQGSFAGPLAIVGTLAMPLLAGMLPMLLLLAARRRGEYVPGFAPRFLGHPVTIVAVASLYLAGVLAHAFVIWEEPISRALALATTAITLATAVAAARQGSFRPRAVLELREAGTRRRPSVQLVSGGRLVAIEGSTTEAPFAERVFGIPSLDVTELTVWAHHATDQGESNPIMGVVEILGSDGSLVTRVAAPDGTATVPISPGGAFGIRFVPGDPTALMSSDATLPTKSRVPSGPVMGLT